MTELGTPQQEEQDTFKSVLGRMLYEYSNYVATAPALMPTLLEAEKERVIKYFGGAEDVYRTLAPNAYELAFHRVQLISKVFICLVKQQDPTGEAQQYLRDMPDFAKLVGGMPDWLKK